MANGLEKFESNWSLNQNYLTSFSAPNLLLGGFNRLIFGSLNLMTNIYTPIVDDFSVPVKFTLPQYAKQLYAYVQVQTGAGVTPNIITIDYSNELNVGHATSVIVGEGMTTGTNILLPLFNVDVGVLSFNTALRNGLPRSGVIQFYGVPDLVESYESSWGPADVGL